MIYGTVLELQGFLNGLEWNSYAFITLVFTHTGTINSIAVDFYLVNEVLDYNYGQRYLQL